MYLIEESLAIVGIVAALAAGLFVAATLLVLTQACTRTLSERARQAASRAADALAELERHPIVQSARN
jgi:cation transport ATPase